MLKHFFERRGESTNVCSLEPELSDAETTCVLLLGSDHLDGQRLSPRDIWETLFKIKLQLHSSGSGAYIYTRLVVEDL